MTTQRDAGIERVSTLAKADAISCYLGNAGPASLSQIARALSLSTSSTHRLLGGLLKQRNVRQLPDRRYALSVSMWEIGVQALGHVHPNLLELASHATQMIAAEVGEAATLSVPLGVETLFIGRTTVPRPVPLYSPTAECRPAYCAAAGKAMLAFQGEAAFEAVCEHGLGAFTESTITRPSMLRGELAAARTAAVALNRGEIQAERFGVGVPVLGADGQPVAGFAVSIPRERWREEVVARATTTLHAHASRLSMALGYGGAVFRQDRLA